MKPLDCHCPGIHSSLSGSLYPFIVHRVTVRAHGTGIEAEGTAALASLEKELVALTTFPVFYGVAGRDGEWFLISCRITHLLKIASEPSPRSP